MATIQIKHVPEETHAVLRKQAAQANQSLQEYLLSKLIDEAKRPSMNEWLTNVDQMQSTDFTVDYLVDVLHDERPRR